MAQQEVGRITIVVNAEVTGDVDAPTAAGPPKLSLEIELPTDNPYHAALVFLRRVADQLEAEIE
ncbi:hypothetical protein SAMN05892883_2093 [Jatrophihabitans sp. GAS493]|uniref:hypothetical protein n=1 Tax=Jatrophihabitans sp. GAS493 TaxID=1907575 RepID=UPI000BB6792B|nr:hypothetical protein [Jatrophihabitans sp. GAS493]SOD72747.1 hypothetical protein SAMN05892883_2093 [Jatrophihabitans sp. GAS493]